MMDTTPNELIYHALAETMLRMHKMIYDLTAESRSKVQQEVNDIAFAAISAYMALKPPPNDVTVN